MADSMLDFQHCSQLLMRDANSQRKSHLVALGIPTKMLLFVLGRNLITSQMTKIGGLR